MPSAYPPPPPTPQVIGLEPPPPVPHTLISTEVTFEGTVNVPDVPAFLAGVVPAVDVVGSDIASGEKPAAYEVCVGNDGNIMGLF